MPRGLFDAVHFALRCWLGIGAAAPAVTLPKPSLEGVPPATETGGPRGAVVPLPNPVPCRQVQRDQRQIRQIRSLVKRRSSEPSRCFIERLGGLFPRLLKELEVHWRDQVSGAASHKFVVEFAYNERWSLVTRIPYES